MKHHVTLTFAACLAMISGAVPAQGADVLVVGPGTVAGLRMGATTKEAKRGGWISRGDMCPGWSTGPKTHKVTSRGIEVFKAYPEKVRAGRLLSMWAAGDVVTRKGVRARSLKTGRGGSTLATVQQAYPRLQRLGPWTPGAQMGMDEDVYTVGSKNKGWLDFYVDNKSRRVSTMVVRSDDVSWRAFTGADGC